MIGRRKFLNASLFGSLGTIMPNRYFAKIDENHSPLKGNPVVISTWNEGIKANSGAWNVLSTGGRALDAVEAGVKITEASQNCCVGLGANPTEMDL
jgi:N4-(beta-N-acetylglucosaminyl)-L-asparaginase